MTDFNSSVVTQPFNISIVTGNGTDQLKTLVAPSWVSTPNVRGTSDILQSCILTLVACIYTALHLDVPKKTTWQYLLWEKFKWVVITLFAPEVAVFVAAAQLRYAWNLKSALRKIQKEQQESSKWTPDADFEINLKYAFFIVMGAVRFDVHDILSFTDLDHAYREHFKGSGLARRSVRSAPASIIWLAERGHWIKIRKQDIDDKSKADTIQKALVLTQVLWMVTQCITRHIFNLPLSLLEIHTVIHVASAVILYVCWFEKPLGVQEAIITPTEGFRGELATMLQKQFYADISHRMALFQPRQDEEQSPPIDADESQMHWIEPQSGGTMSEGDILPSGLALSATKVKKSYTSPVYYLDPSLKSTDTPLILEPEFLARWNAIFATYPFEDRGRLAQESERIVMQSFHEEDEPQDSTSSPKILYLPIVEELKPLGQWVTDGERLFWETESMLHLHSDDLSEKSEKKDWKTSTIKPDLTFWSWQFFLLAIFLTSVYGGVHLSMQGRAFPSYVEDIMWKTSCLILILWLPATFIIFIVLTFPWVAMEEWREKHNVGAMFKITYYLLTGLNVFIGLLLCLAYISARAFVIIESFLCLRRSPNGIFMSVEWLEIFPHF